MRRSLLAGKFFSCKDVGKTMAALLISLALLLAVGYAEEEGSVQTDASGRWKYFFQDRGATVTDCVDVPGGDLVIPGQVDGYPVTGIGARLLEDLTVVSVTLPESVAQVSPYSFSDCHTLERIEVSPENPVYESIEGVLFEKSQRMLVAYPYGAGESYAIPSGTRVIGNSAFAMRSSLKGITIPEGVTHIEQYAFASCSNLGEVTIPSSVTSIGKSAFDYCRIVGKITLSEGLMEIGQYAFAHCRALPAAVIPEGVVSIGYGAFTACDSLRSISIPESVAFIGEHAFTDCDTLTLIVCEGSFAQQYAKENDLPYVFPENAREIEATNALDQWAYTVNADGETITLTKYEGLDVSRVDVPREIDGFRVTGLGGYAFDECFELTHLTLPDSITWVSSYAFVYSYDLRSYLASIEVAAGNPVYTSVDGVLFDKSKSMLHTYPSEKEGLTYQVPEGITALGDNAFTGCMALQVILPDSLVSIGEAAFYATQTLVIRIPKNVEHIAKGAFVLTELAAIDVDPENPVYASVDGVLMDKRVHMLHTYPSGRGADAYAVPEGIVSIAERAFYLCTSLEEVTFPRSLTTIESEAFHACYSLLSIGLPESLISIGSDAFSACRLVPEVWIPASVTHIGSGAFNAFSMASIEVDPQNPAYASVDGVLFDKSMSMLHTYPQSKEGRAYTVPDGITAIEASTLNPYSYLTQITLPGSLTAIGEYSLSENLIICGPAGSFAQRYAEENGNDFIIDYTQEEGADASGQWKYVLEDGSATITGCVGEPIGELFLPGELDGYPVTRIGDMAFAYGQGISGVSIPESVTQIGSRAFYDCRNLTFANLPAGVQTMGSHAFYGCGLTQVTLPQALTDIPDYAFAANPLISVMIPDGVTGIGEAAFAYCSDLAGVTIPGSVTDIGVWAFFECYGLTNATILHGVRYIDDAAFSSCGGLTDVLIPASIQYIGEDVFYGCLELTLTLPQGSYAQQYAMEKDFPYALEE